MDAVCARCLVSSPAILGSTASGSQWASNHPVATPPQTPGGPSCSLSVVVSKRLTSSASRSDSFMTQRDWSHVDSNSPIRRKPRQQATTPLRVLSAQPDRSLVGEDFGGRDATLEEKESNFGAKVLGNADTEHIILIPDVSKIAGLPKRNCEPLPRGTKPWSLEEARPMLRKIVGWKMVDHDGVLYIQASWAVKDFNAGLELFKRVAAVAEAEGHHPDLYLKEGDKVSIEISTHSIGGLSINDFILAAKIDLIDMKDLVKKSKKFWA